MKKTCTLFTVAFSSQHIHSPPSKEAYGPEPQFPAIVYEVLHSCSHSLIRDIKGALRNEKQAFVSNAPCGIKRCNNGIQRVPFRSVLPDITPCFRWYSKMIHFCRGSCFDFFCLFRARQSFKTKPEPQPEP